MSARKPISVESYTTQYSAEFEDSSRYFGMECQEAGSGRATRPNRTTLHLAYGLSQCTPFFVRTRDGLFSVFHAAPLGLIQGEHEADLEALRLQGGGTAIFVKGTQTIVSERDIKIVEQYGLETKGIVEVDTGRQHWETLYHPLLNRIYVDRSSAKEVLQFEGFK